MYAAVAPFSGEHFITPMAAVAGAVAEEILKEMTTAAPTLERAYVNNGGDIACYFGTDEPYSIGLVDRPDRPSIFGRAIVSRASPVRGIATSGRHGRSFSLGIADAVTILADTASKADAAATMIANSVDLPTNGDIVRRPAWDLDPDSDLQWRLVVRDVPILSKIAVHEALSAGTLVANSMMRRGLINGAVLHLQGETRTASMQEGGGRPSETSIFSLAACVQQ